MTGYLQRLVDSTLPASEPPALAPVVKSTSPIFEQNQLLGLSGFQAGETDAEIMAPAPDAPGPQDPNAPVPPVAAAAPPPREIPQHDSRPATPASWPGGEVGPPLDPNLLTPRPVAADAAAALPQDPSVTVLGPVQSGPEIFGPAMPRATVAAPAPQRAAGMPETRVPRKPGVRPADTERAAPEATPLIAPEATSEPDTQESPAAPGILTSDTPRALDSDTPRALDIDTPRALDSDTPRALDIDTPRALDALERAPDASPPPSVLEPRPRPDFDDVEPAADQPQPETPQASPRITIGRVTVEIVPDPTPVTKPAGTSRTAAAASMIGPLGNRRARRRLFALSRL